MGHPEFSRKNFLVHNNLTELQKLGNVEPCVPTPIR